MEEGQNDVMPEEGVAEEGAPAEGGAEAPAEGGEESAM